MMINFVLFYGHFEIVKVSKFLLIRLFYYDGLLEELIDDCLDFFGRGRKKSFNIFSKGQGIRNQQFREESDRNFLIQTRSIVQDFDEN